MPVFQRSIVDQAGNVMPSASVEVRDQVTSTLVQLYSDYDLATTIGNPITADADGFVRFYVAAGRYRIVATSGVVSRTWEDEILLGALRSDLASAISGADGSRLVGYRRADTGAAARSLYAVLAVLWPTLQDFGAVGDGVTDDSTALQSAMTACAGKWPIRIPKTTSFYSVAGKFTASSDIRFLPEDGAEVRWASTSATGSNFLGSATRPGFDFTGDNFTIEGRGKFTGPSTATYVENECAIYMHGASTSSRKSGLHIGEAEFTKWGSYGILAQFVDNITVDRTYVHDCGYAGMAFLSCNHGRISNPRVIDIGPGTAGNMYGISLSHDSTSYSSDPDAGTKEAVHPFCWDWDISGAHVEGVAWEGIDCHGGYDIHIHHCKVYATQKGIACASGSGDATAYAGWNNSVTDCLVDAANADGTVSGYENDSYGISMNGGTTVNHQNIICARNTVIGKGVLGNANTGAIQVNYCNGGHVSNNIIRKWGGTGITVDGASNLHITYNQGQEIGGAAAGAEYFISMEAVTANGKTFTIVGNTMIANGGTAGRNGFRSTSITTLPLFKDNAFSAATVSAYSLASPFTMLSEGFPMLAASVSNAGGGAAEVIDLASMSRYGKFTVYVTSGNAASEISNLTNGVQGQEVTLFAANATAWIFTRANAVLSAGANQPAGGATANDILTLMRGPAGWVQLAPCSVNS